MALELDSSITVVGGIEVAIYLKDDGSLGLAFGIDGISPEAAIGYIQVVHDRMRDERRFAWDTCIECGQPMESHGLDLEDDEDEDDDA